MGRANAVLGQLLQPIANERGDTGRTGRHRTARPRPHLRTWQHWTARAGTRRHERNEVEGLVGGIARGGSNPPSDTRATKLPPPDLEVVLTNRYVRERSVYPRCGSFGRVA